MSSPRRDFIRELLAASAFPGLLGSSRAAGALGALLDPQSAEETNPELDAKAIGFWSNFAASDDKPIVGPLRKTRGGGPNPDEAKPVFWHYGTEGFKEAARLDPSKMVPEGDVMVSVNTSTVKIATEDQKTFQRLQNAQIRVDVAQKTAILPILEAMAYTVVGGMKSVENARAKAKVQPTVQSISVASDADWQKMQNIPLPQGKGRWALNLEAQKKDSLFCKIVQNVVKQGGLFVPMIGFPGIVMSALNSFNTIYGVLHSGTVPIIQGNAVPVYATQAAAESTGAPGAASGILLQSGTYILMPAKQAPPIDQVKNLTVTQGRLVPPNTADRDLDDAAADTLKDVTYVTFDVEVTPTNLLTSTPVKKSG